MVAQKIMEIKNNKLTDYIKIFDDVLPKEVHENFLKYLKHSDDKFLIAGVQGTKNKPDRVVKNIRNSFLWFPRQINCSISESHWASLISFFCKKIYRDYANMLNLKDCDNISELSFLKYEKGNHYQKFHVDQGRENRSFSLVYWVNDNYKGGAFSFKNPTNQVEIKIDKQENRAVVFPSNFLYPHRVNPVEEGTRYSVVSWAR